MPIYVYRCPQCGREAEEIRRVSEADAAPPRCFGDRLVPPPYGTSMVRVPQAASFGFKTRGGNFASFSPSHGPVTRGNRRPRTISRGNGLGGHRPPASPKRDPEFRERIVKMIGEKVSP